MTRGRIHPSGIGASAIGIALILIAWLVAARAVGATIILPGPGAALRSLWTELTNPVFYTHLAATLARALAGFVLAFVTGLAWGLVAGSRRGWGGILRPSLVLIRATPVIAIILLALIWFRADISPVFVALLMVLPVIVENVAAGVRAGSGELAEMASLFGVPRRRRLGELTLPALRPYLFAAAHSGLGMAFKVTVAAEVIVQPSRALGGAMQEARFYLDTPRILALTIAVIALSALAEGVLSALERAWPGYVHLRARDGDAAPARIAASDARVGEGASARNVSKRFAEHLVLADLSLEVAAGVVTVVLGPSGCGKTTLLRILAGLDEPDHGVVRRPGRPSFAFQEPRLLPWADVSANVGFVLDGEVSPAVVSGWLETARLRVRPNAMPGTLSGGMQSRLALARAFACDAPLLLLDEPFQNLDLAVKLELAAAVREVTSRRNRTTVMVTHDVVEALLTADRIVILGGEPATIVGERPVVLGRHARDPRTREAQVVAADLYDALLAARTLHSAR